jgi:large subunit ribosomal protein L4
MKVNTRLKPRKRNCKMDPQCLTRHCWSKKRFDIQQPKTREVVQMVKHFTDQRKVLLLVSEPHESLHLSARNIPDMKVLPIAGLNVYDLLHYTTVICAEEAIEKIVGRLT